MTPLDVWSLVLHVELGSCHLVLTTTQKAEQTEKPTTDLDL